MAQWSIMQRPFVAPCPRAGGTDVRRVGTAPLRARHTSASVQGAFAHPTALDKLEIKMEKPMSMKFASGFAALVGMLLAGTSARAADTTYERLLNPDKEPQNWLMNHRDYGSQRFSPLDQINTSNVKNLKLKFAIALGGSAGNESLEATPLVEDGFMYIADGWGVVYKIDVRSGT